MTDKRYDLEQEIMNCWNILSDIKTLYENVIEGDHLTKDNIANMLLGIEQLYELKFGKLFNTFEATCFRTNNDSETYYKPHSVEVEDPECICKGNWRQIVKETEHLIGQVFVYKVTGKRYRFYGIIHGEDDYYYGMYLIREKTSLMDGQEVFAENLRLSCVGSIEGHGFELENKNG